MKILLFLFISAMAASDLQKCLNDYNAALSERNNSLGSFKIAQSQRESADGKVEKWERKKYIEEAKESVIFAIDQLAKSEALLKQIKTECIQAFVDKANEISTKNIESLNEYEAFRKEMELILQLPK